MRIDLHCHSIHSGDSDMTVARLVETAVAKGLDGIGLTDHDSVSGHSELLELASVHPELVLVPGCEVASREGHVLAYGVELVPPPKRPLSETVENILGQGGVAVLAHPFRYGNGVNRQTLVASSGSLGSAGSAGSSGISVECINGRSWELYNSRVRRMGEQEGWTMMGGSDSHTGAEVGSAWTAFPPEIDSVRDALEALGRGEATPGGRGLSLAGLMVSKMRGIKRRLVKHSGPGKKPDTKNTGERDGR